MPVVVTAGAGRRGFQAAPELYDAETELGDVR